LIFSNRLLILVHFQDVSSNDVFVRNFGECVDVGRVESEVIDFLLVCQDYNTIFFNESDFVVSPDPLVFITDEYSSVVVSKHFVDWYIQVELVHYVEIGQIVIQSVFSGLKHLEGLEFELETFPLYFDDGLRQLFIFGN